MKRELPNGCSCSEISVYPKNWKQAGASVKIDWYLQFYFYDPHGEKKKLLVIKKRMNRYKTLQLRREATEILINTLNEVLESGFNPITKKTISPIPLYGDIHPQTRIIESLELASNKIKVKKATLADIKSALGFIKKSIVNLQLDTLKVQDVRRKHIRMILDNCGKIKDYWSGHLFNHYRAYLMVLFNELVELEAIDTNPVRDISKQIVVERLREFLTLEERIAIDDHFKNTDPYFRRFLHIFFHSGARPIELLELTDQHVDLNKQVYKVTVNKGGKIREEHRPIKDIALPYWTEIISEVKPGHYLFGQFLIPSEKKSTRDYITKKWQREVKDDKKGLGIKKDLYSLKHLNLDETAQALSIYDAQRMAGHSSPVITMKHYATGEKGRQNDRLRSVNNKFAG